MNFAQYHIIQCLTLRSKDSLHSALVSTRNLQVPPTYHKVESSSGFVRAGISPVMIAQARNASWV